VLVAFCAVALPLLVSDGLDGFAVGMAVVTAVSLVARWWYLTRLFPAFALARYVVRAVAPVLPAVGAVLVLRADVFAELAVYVAITAAMTVALERSLLREVLGYLRRDRSPAGAAVA